jgi:hypothetical protein
MEPITTGLGIVKGLAELGQRLYDVLKNLKDREAKQHVGEILDKLQELKQRASQLEDENRDLREKLRFKSEEFEFRTPFWYRKSNDSQPLCPKCFAKEIAAPMWEPGQRCNENYRRCSVCESPVQVGKDAPQVLRQRGYDPAGEY